MLKARSFLIGAIVTVGLPFFAEAQNLSTYGTPGLIDMPTAEVLPDGNLALTSTTFKNTNRSTLTFQMLPWVYGSFRYAYIQDFDFGGNLSRYDRSFDIHFQLREENRRSPALAVGLRDFGGTGIYASEYIAATKTFADRFVVTGGMGWGRLAGRGSFKNPLALLGDRFETRPGSNVGGISTTGQLDFGNWFRGDAALFGGVRWDVNHRMSLMAEYSSDVYDPERSRNVFEVNSPLNFGVNYRFDNGVTLNGYYMYGSTLGMQLSYALDPRRPSAPGGQGDAAPPLLPIDTVALASWNLPPEQRQRPGLDAEEVIRTRLEEQGMRLVGYSSEGDLATVVVENNRYGASAQALGRTARIMANTLPPEVETFDVTLARRGVAITSTQTQRSDLYELEYDLDGVWKNLARAQVKDAPFGLKDNTADGAFPYFGYRFGPYMQLSFFDPDQPLRYEFGADLQMEYIVAPGITFSGAFRQPVVGNLDATTRTSNSVLQHVRSDWAEYAKQSDFRVSQLTAEYIWRPREDWFARVTGGYLEEMFGGFSAELLWFPVNSRLALGGEVNYVKQRNFDVLFGFQDYDVVTGHLSAYYNLPGDYHGQVDLGRYLAGDWGATFTLDREFNNGFKVGAFFTLTSVSSSDFGEGSFDKGIRIEVPVSWLSGRPSKNTLKQVIRPVLRDGGARLSVPNRLYGYTREARIEALAARWGRYYR